tara:strand:+ start:632 stop:1183 length:552 start_codon:yes stop_codon:yes gene_type:complete
MSPTYPESLSINKGRYSGDTATALVDGTVAQPSIAFADDSDTGIYSPADGTVCLTVNGEDAIKCIADGAVELNHNNNKKLETTSAGVTVTGSVTETSDIALKTNIEPIDNVLDKIQQITGYQYQFKNTGNNSMGIIAQDVEKVFPQLVHGEEGSKSLQYSGLIGALIESVKELSAKVAALEAR